MLLEILSFFISFFSSSFGAVTGIGGGVIIKPALDATRTMPVSSISFLSGVTVLSMTSMALLRSRKADFKLEVKTSLLLVAGGGAGGILGQGVFNVLREYLNDENLLGAVQSGLLLFLVLGVLVYMAIRRHLKIYEVKNVFGCLLAGASLGTVSAFLGIGGGPFNVVVLYWVFGMDEKTAAKNSLFIIFLSQLFGLITALATGAVPDFRTGILVFMVAGGILGGIAGMEILKRISIKRTQSVFMAVLVIILGVTLYNIYHFLS